MSAFGRWIRALGLAVGLAAGARSGAGEGDWPTHRGNAGRTGQGSTSLGFPLRRAWVHHESTPRPAWGPPARRSYWQRLEHLEARVVDDHAFPAVVAGDAVLYGSSADDQVRCLDLADGRLRWAFWTDGPVRFAPVVDADRVYFGSDDGWIYALGLADGRRVWRHRPGPEDWRIPGNGRLISSWPVRTGVLVDRGTVYATAGLYPQQGAWACALDSTDGRLRWQVPLEDSPDGYLLATERMLVVPTGRASPVGLDRATGAWLRRFDTGGGTYAVAAGDEIFGGPGDDGTLTGVAAPTGERLVTVKGRNLVAADGRLFLLENGELKAIDRVRQAAIRRRSKEIETRLVPLQERQRRAGAAGLPEAERAELGRLREAVAGLGAELDACVLWRVPCAEDLSLVGTREALVAGGSNGVAAYDRTTGRRLWQGDIQGRALALAVAQGRLVVSTDRGSLVAFAAGSDTGAVPDPVLAVKEAVGGPEPESPEVRSWLDRLVAAGLPSRGYVLVAGLGSGRLVEALLRRTELHVVVVDADRDRVDRWRSRWRAEGYYGARASVHAVAPGSLPFTDEFANAVVSEALLEGAGTIPWPAGEPERLVRPFGGLRWDEPASAPAVRGPLPGAGSWTHQYGNPANTASSGDRRIHAGLALQWFGGPGPDLMVDRHLRAPAPLGAGGRLFVPGENRLLAVDAFNGAELWQCELPGSQRYSMPYDAGYQSVEGDRLAVAVRDACWLLDASNGRVTARLPVPVTGPAEANRGWHWGYVALVEGALYGTAQESGASRTVPGYEQIDVDYNNAQPLVTGRALFRVDPDGGRLVWERRRGVILNPTITVHRGRVVFVEARGPRPAEVVTGRIPLATLLAADPWLVSLEAATGAVAWEQPLTGELATSRNILYLVGAGERLALVGSRVGAGDDTQYLVECRNAATGQVEWTGSHAAGQPGAFTHGEQVHHPVVLDDLLVAEPVVYDLATGRLRTAPGGAADWRLIRPGHSCGTLSGAGDCLFFRANNPTVLDLRASLRSSEPPRKLAPSRAGCWINMIPAAGLLLVPEASAGCVCQYSLQTSMAFRPRGLPAGGGTFR